MPMAKPKEEKMLTEAELELMSVLWKIGEGSVADVIEQLPKGRSQAYTTISTILRILEQKEFLRARKEGRGHLYKPRLQKEEYEARTVKHVVEKVFEGAPVALARQLLMAEGLSESDLAELRALIDGRKSKPEAKK